MPFASFDCIVIEAQFDVAPAANQYARTVTSFFV